MSTATNIDHNNATSLLVALQHLAGVSTYDHILLSNSVGAKKLILHIHPLDYRLSWYDVQKDGKSLTNASDQPLQFSRLDDAVTVYASL